MGTMTTPKTHINDSIRQINPNSWLIAGELLLSRQSSPPPPNDNTPLTSWPDSTSKESFFTLTPAPIPPPASHPLPHGSPSLPLVYAAGDQSAVWRAGEAFIKAHDILWPKATREHVPLEFLARKRSQGYELDFDFPRVLYHDEIDERYFLIVSRVPGQTLAEAWPSMDEATRQSYVRRVADICKDLAEWKGIAVCGVDGGQLLEVYLAKGGSKIRLKPGRLRQNCAEMGMDVSSTVFYHCDLGPGNILVDLTKGLIGIVDWELAGYVPREWVKTKFNLSSGMDFPDGEESQRSDWRRLVARGLAEIGFGDVIDGWLEFRSG